MPVHCADVGGIGPPGMALDVSSSVSAGPGAPFAHDTRVVRGCTRRRRRVSLRVLTAPFLNLHPRCPRSLSRRKTLTRRHVRRDVPTAGAGLRAGPLAAQGWGVLGRRSGRHSQSVILTVIMYNVQVNLNREGRQLARGHRRRERRGAARLDQRGAAGCRRRASTCLARARPAAPRPRARARRRP